MDVGSWAVTMVSFCNVSATAADQMQGERGDWEVGQWVGWWESWQVSQWVGQRLVVEGMPLLNEWVWAQGLP